MATQETGGGSTTSFTNTPQANADTYNYIEDELRANALLYNISTHTTFLDVMSNDLGGKAKALFSIDDGQGALTELLQSNVTTGWEQTTDGNWIRINAGKIEFRIGNGTNNSSDVRDVNSLGEGDTIDDTFLYAIRMANGTLAYSTVHITITGANDNATISGDNDGALNEDGVPNTTSGTLVVSDVDAGENELQPILAGTAGDNGYGTFEVLANGQWTYTLDNSNPAVQALADGAVVYDMITVTSEDGTDTEVITITITGTNDGPVANADTDTTSENASILVDVLANDTDADTGAVLTITAASAPAGQGSASVVGNQVEFDPGTDFDYLAVGESVVVTVSYTIEDEHGAPSGSTIDITVTGTNDGPDAVADTDTTDEDNSVLVDVLANDSDPDASDVLTISDADVTSGLGSVAIESGKLRYDPGTAYNYLAVGEEAEVVITYEVDDGHGGTDTATLTITVTGTNDGPVANADAYNATEDTPLTFDVRTNDTDADNSDTLTVTHVNGTAISVGGSVVITGGSISLGADGQLTYTPTADFNGTPSFNYTISDGNGGSSTATVNLTVAAVADIVGDTAATNQNTAVTTAVLANDNFEGSPNVTAVTQGANGSVTINLDNTVTYTPNSGFTGADSYTYTVTSGGVTETATVNVTVNAPANVAPTAANDVWVLSDATLLPANTITPTWFLNNDTDPDSPTLYVTNVTGLPVGMVANYDLAGHLVSITGTTPAVGSYTLNYMVTDGIASTPASVTMTVIDTTTGNPGDNITLDGNDFSYVDLLTGNDTINGDLVLTGNAGKDIFIGSNNDDTLNGGAGDDQLFGGSNNDTLNGGLGNDVLTGGNNTDSFIFNSPLAAANADSITDYAAGEIIDITAILSVTTATNVVTGGYLRLTTTGLLQVDLDGGGNNWVTVTSMNLGVNATVRYDLSDGTTQTVVLTPVAPPIALDLDGDGQISFLGTDDGATFDYGGGTVATAWVAANDGILVRDGNHDGQISADEIVFATSGSDLEGLAAHDTNQDGQLSADDAGFTDFGVWQDADSDGQVDAGELQSLAAHSIASISLSSDQIGYSAAGGDVSVVGTGSFTRTDGSTGVLADAVFATGGRASEIMGRSSAFGNNTILLAAVAAAGLASAPAEARNLDESAGDGDLDGTNGPPMAAMIVSRTLDASDMSAVNGAADFGPESIGHSASLQAADFGSLEEANHSLIGTERAEAVELTALLDATAALQTGFPAHSAVVATGIAIPPAEFLAAALASDIADNGASSNLVAQILADAFAEGVSDVDAMLEAVLTPQATEQLENWAQMSSDLASHGGADAFGWGSFAGVGLAGSPFEVSFQFAHPDTLLQG